MIKAQATSDDSGGKLSQGDASILRFLCAIEILDSDLWEQYWELVRRRDQQKNHGSLTSRSSRSTPAFGASTGPTTRIRILGAQISPKRCRV
jgi:hypothetical protein